MAKATRSKNGLYLLGDPVSELTGSKLPSLRMALGFFLHIQGIYKESINRDFRFRARERKCCGVRVCD